MKKLVSALAMSLALVPMAQAKSIAGVDIPDQLNLAGADLTLNGAGIRTKFMMDIYVGGLYLPAANKDAAAVVSADQPMAIRLHMVSGMITSDKMKDATNEGFQNSLNGNTAPLKSQIDAFISVFDAEIKKGDVFDLVYVPGKGVEVLKNGQAASTIDGGLEFKKALFGIWLSDKPAQEDLKKAMLGS